MRLAGAVLLACTLPILATAWRRFTAGFYVVIADLSEGCLALGGRFNFSSWRMFFPLQIGLCVASSLRRHNVYRKRRCSP